MRDNALVKLDDVRAYAEKQLPEATDRTLYVSEVVAFAVYVGADRLQAERIARHQWDSQR